MKEYKMAKGWAIFFYVFAPVLIAVFAMPILMYFIPSWRNGETNAVFFAFAIPISLLLIGMTVVVVVDSFVGKLSVSEEEVHLKHVFLNRRLRISDIKGFRTDDNYIYLLPEKSNLKRIKISHYYGEMNQLIDWVVAHFPDLDYQEAEESFQEVLQDNNYGFTEQERLEQFDKAKRVTTVLNWIGGIAAVWAFFWPQPYALVIIVLAIIPILALLVLKLYRGLVRIVENNNSVFPSVSAALIFPILILMYRTLVDYNIFEHQQVWVLVVPLAIVFVMVMLSGQREFDWQRGKDVFLGLILSTLAFVYAYGLVISTNCTFDNRSAAAFDSEILGKRIGGGKTTTYYLELAPWGPQPEVGETSVSRRLYQQMEIGDSVEIMFYKGHWGIPWYRVRPQIK